MTQTSHPYTSQTFIQFGSTTAQPTNAAPTQTPASGGGGGSNDDNTGKLVGLILGLIVFLLALTLISYFLHKNGCKINLKLRFKREKAEKHGSLRRQDSRRHVDSTHDNAPSGAPRQGR
jgi:hypothetical protein